MNIQERVAHRFLDDMIDHGSVEEFVEKLIDHPEQYLSELAVAAIDEIRRSDVRECLITESMIDAGHAASDEYDRMIKGRVFPRPIKVAYVFSAMQKARLKDGGFAKQASPSGLDSTPADGQGVD